MSSSTKPPVLPWRQLSRELYFQQRILRSIDAGPLAMIATMIARSRRSFHVAWPLKTRGGYVNQRCRLPGLNAVIRGAEKCAEQLGYDAQGFQRGYEGLVAEPAGAEVAPQQLSSQNISGIF